MTRDADSQFLTSANADRWEEGSGRTRHEPQREAVTIWQFTSGDAREALAARASFLASLRQHAGSRLDEYAAKLIFSELVSNVIRHTPGAITITLILEHTRAIIRVDDMGSGFDCSWALPKEPYSPGGRGLFIAAKFATDIWIARRDGGGATVFATMALKQ